MNLKSIIKNIIFKKIDFKCKTCLKSNIKSCSMCMHAFYRLNIFVNKIRLIE